MITQDQLNEAIAECNGRRNPDANTCLKLASYLTIRDKMYPDAKSDNKPILSDYSYASPPVVADGVIDYTSDTQFGKAIRGRKVNDVLSQLDEIISDVYVVEPSLYRKIMRELGI